MRVIRLGVPKAAYMRIRPKSLYFLLMGFMIGVVLMWVCMVSVHSQAPPCPFDPESGTYPCLLLGHGDLGRQTRLVGRAARAEGGTQRARAGKEVGKPPSLGNGDDGETDKDTAKDYSEDSNPDTNRETNREADPDTNRDTKKNLLPVLEEDTKDGTPDASNAGADAKDAKESAEEAVEAPPPGGKARLVIYSLHRSGSSFTGEIFGRHRDAFYMYEPFQLYPFGAPRKHDHINRVGGPYLRRLLQCDPQPLLDDVRAFHPNSSVRIKQFSRRVFCQPYQFVKYKVKGTNKTVSCDFNDPPQLAKRCQTKSAVVTKLVTLKNFTSLVPLLKEGVRVVHLVRDPRGQILSIKKMGSKIDLYSKMSIVQTATHICQVLKEGVQLSRELLKTDAKVRQNYRRVRIEDIMKDPKGYSQKLYRFAGLSETRNTKAWLKDVTKAKGTHVDAYNKVWSWRSRIPYDYVFIIQALCGDVLQTLGYQKVDSVEHLWNLNVTLHRQPTDSVGWL